MSAVAEEVREETPWFRAREREQTRRPEADRWLLLPTVFLVAVGLVLVLSASQAPAYVHHPPAHPVFHPPPLPARAGDPPSAV